MPPDLLAHGLGGRSDLPIPLWLAVYGATAAVLISFVALARLWTRPRLDGSTGGRRGSAAVPRVLDSPGLRTALRVLGLLAFAWLLAVAWGGSDDPATNPAPTWFYVWWWVGLVPASLLLGPVARLLSPFRSLAELIRMAVGRTAIGAETVHRWGYWPAIAGLVAFLWLELAFPGSDDPRTVAVFLSLYTVAQVTAAVVLGPDWCTRGEGFEVYSSLFARLAPIGRVKGNLLLRNPFAGLARLTDESGSARASSVAVCVVVLGSTAFDGISRTTIWRDIGRSVDGDVLTTVVSTVGLVGSIAVVGAVYLLAARTTRPFLADRELTTMDVAAAFTHSLVPIAVGYTVAHYFSFAVFQGQAGFLLAGDPFGAGPGAAIDYTVLTPAVIAVVQIAAIVAGHIGGVVAAQDRSLGLLRRRQRTAGQYPMLAAMVGFTSLGIALLAGT